MARRKPPERSPYAAEPPSKRGCATPEPPCQAAARRKAIGIDDVTWAMMLLAIREPSRTEEKRESA